MPSPILQLFRRAASDPAARDCSDQELLRRFVAERDGAAFEAIVRRHGPMVRDVCRAVLGTCNDAEDAFQVTFLVLVRKAGSVRKAASLASWLHGVARRTALKAKAGSARHQRHGAPVPERGVSDPDNLSWSELRRVLHEELSQLPRRYREPLVLCYLEGSTQDDAATCLGLSKGTLRRRLEQGRALLRERLVRRGVGPAAVLFAAAWPAVAVAELPPATVASTLIACTAFATGALAVSAEVTALTGGVLRAMFMTKLKHVAVVLLTATAIATGTGALVHATVQRSAEEPKRPMSGNERTPSPKTEGAAEWKPRATLEGHKDDVVAFAFGVDQLMSAGKDGNLVLWDSNTGKEIRSSKYDPAIGPMENMTFTPDGKSLFLRYGDQIALWDIAKKTFPKAGIGGGIPVATLVGPGEGYTVVLRRVENKKSILVEDVASFAEIGDEILGFRMMKTVGSCDTAHDVVQVAVDQKRSFLAGAMTSQDIAIYNFASKELSVLKGNKQDVIAMEFSPDCKLFASAGSEGTVLVRSVDGWKELANLKGHVGAVSSIAFSPDSKQLATAGDDKTISIWDVTSGKRIVILNGHTEAILRVAFSRDGKVLASAGKDKTVRLWEFTK